jgi:hypothetical protein
MEALCRFSRLLIDISPLQTESRRLFCPESDEQ